MSCTQVHQLGQVVDGNSEGSGASSASSDASGDASEAGTGDSSSSQSSETDEDSSATSADASESASTLTESGDGDGDVGDGDGDGDGDAGDGDGDGDSGDGDSGGPIPQPCEVVDLGGNEGLSAEISLMTQWNDGACHDIYVTNDSEEDVIWHRDLRFGGTLDSSWNADYEELTPTDFRFEGQATAGNVLVLSGDTVHFGTCMTCMP